MAKKKYNRNVGDYYGASTITVDEYIDMLVNLSISGSRQAVIAISPPGIGKSHAVDQAGKIAYEKFFKHLGYEYFDRLDKNSKHQKLTRGVYGVDRINVSQTETSVLTGMKVPNPKTRELVTYAYSNLPVYDKNQENGLEQRGIFHWDEFGRGKSSTAEDVRNNAMEHMDGAKSQGIEFPPGILQVASTNPDDGSHRDVAKISKALFNRVVVVGVTTNLRIWSKYAVVKQHPDSIFPNIHPSVLQFVEDGGENALYDYEGLAKGVGVYATPRSLHKLSVLMFQLECAKMVHETKFVPSLEKIKASFPECYANADAIHAWLTVGANNEEVFSGWMGVEQHFHTIKGLIGVQASKFIEIAKEHDRMISVDACLNDFESIKHKIEMIANSDPDQYASLVQKATHVLMSQDPSLKRTGKMIDNFGKMLMLTRDDVRVMAVRLIIDYFVKSSTGKNWHESKFAAKWANEFEKHPSLDKNFQMMLVTEHKLKIVATQHKKKNL